MIGVFNQFQCLPFKVKTNSFVACGDDDRGALVDVCS